MSFIDHIPQSEKSSVRVAVRVRPLNKREKDTKSITEVTNDSVLLINPATKKKKKFTYDFLYDVDTEQQELYNDIGKRVINNAFQGYNSCVFAYGLTGCFARGTPIMMIDGTYKAVEDVGIKDVLMGDDSTERNVVKLFRGRQNMYRIKPKLSGYDEYIVNEDHMMVFEVNCNANIRWVTARNHWIVLQYVADDNMMRKKSFTPVDLSEDAIETARQNALTYMNTLDQTNKIVEMSVKDYINTSSYKKYYLNCITTGVDFPEQEVELNPYFLGVWLGDGSKNNTLVTTIDQPISDYIEAVADEHGCDLATKGINYTIVKGIGKNGKTNPVRTLLKKYNVFNNKHIPSEYKHNSREIRLKVLAGLIDSDGFYDSNKGNFEIMQKRKVLAEDIVYLCRSLGYYASINSCRKGCLYKGEMRMGTYYRCLINGMNMNEIPTLLARKTAVSLTETPRNYHCWRPVVEPLGEGNYYGFMLDGNHRFIGAGFNILRNSGKTHSMMGSKDQPGLIPRICQNLFTKQETHNNIDKEDCKVSYRVELSYLEIYSEQVIDLMDPDCNDLKVRQHPDYGPYVENLTQLLVEDYKSIRRIIDQGNKDRHVASTAMNDRSSRSHAILTVYFTQIVEEGNITREVVSKINLVDLAGSERVEASGVTGVNFKEAIEINKSLSALGLVISKLAAKATKSAKAKPKAKVKPKAKPKTKAKTKTIKKNAEDHIPFRDSVLTWILKESLGGNSKTYMVATISPSSGNYNETLSTLRYASNAKQIVNTVKINEDPNDKIIRVLRDEINLLRSRLNTKRESGILNSPEIRQLTEELQQREELMKEKEKSWTSKLEESRSVAQKAVAQHKEELATKQEEFKSKLARMNDERNNMLTEMEALKVTMSDQEIIQQQAIEAEVAKAQDEFEKRQDEFEKTKIVETAVSLQEYYDTRLEKIKKEYESKEAVPNAEFDQLKQDNNNLRNQLSKNQKDLQFQMRRFTNERAVLSKQITHMTSKIRTLELSMKDTTVHEQAYNAIKAKRDAEEQKFNALQHNFELLNSRIENDQKTLDELNVKHTLITDEIHNNSERLEQLKSEYSQLQAKFKADKEAYDQLLVRKDKLHADIVALRNTLNAYVADARKQITNPTEENLLQIQKGFDAIADSIKK